MESLDILLPATQIVHIVPQRSAFENKKTASGGRGGWLEGHAAGGGVGDDRFYSLRCCRRQLGDASQVYERLPNAGIHFDRRLEVVASQFRLIIDVVDDAAV